MLSGHVASHLLDHIRPVFSPPPLRFSDNNQAFLIVHLDGEGTDRTRLQAIIGLFYRSFDILRVAIDPAYDDQVLQAPRDKQLAVADEP